MTIAEYYTQLAKEVLESFHDQDDGLAPMVLLHTHRIRLCMPILDDRPSVTQVDAITQRHAAEVLAASWPDRGDVNRTDQRYWFYQFNLRTPFEVVEDVSSEWTERVEKIRQLIANSPTVEAISPSE